MNILEFKDVTFSIKNKNIINNVNLSVQSNDIYGILGHNGSGKSTILQLSQGIIKNYQGSIKLFNNEIKNISKNIFQKIGYQSQSGFSLYDLKVYEIFQLFASIYKIKINNSYIMESLGEFNMSNMYSKYYSILSGGEKQILSIIFAMLVDFHIESGLQNQSVYTADTS